MPVFFIEGLPGSGKTTFAKRLEQYLIQQGKTVILYQEGDLHPIDLAWCSVMKQADFDTLLKKYSHLKNDILSHTKQLNDTLITAYTKVTLTNKDTSFYDDFGQYEIYRGQDLSIFLDMHIPLYEAFAQHHQSETYYIFECILLQNHVNELILKYNQSLDEMKSYYQTLTSSIKHLPTELFYIKQMDIDSTLSRIIEERRTDNKDLYKDWIDLVVEYWGSQPYAKQLGYEGIEGAYSYFKDRQLIELQLLSDFPLSHEVIELNESYDDTFEKIIQLVNQKWL